MMSVILSTIGTIIIGAGSVFTGDQILFIDAAHTFLLYMILCKIGGLD